jgi:acyl-CoA reductase-like NAD-dependent aldehyde dehydrogenase
MIRSFVASKTFPISSKSLRSYHFRPQYGAFINGKEHISKDGIRYKMHSPASGEYLCDIVNTPENVTNEAIDVAQAVFDSGIWSKADVRHRAKVLNNIADGMRAEIPRLLELEVAQTGRAIKEMRAQLGRLPEWFEYFSALIRTHEGTVPPFSGSYINYVKRVPLGVCGLLTPWNHPMLIAVKKIAPALAAGNSIVLKPSELAPVSVIELGDICKKAGLPDGVFNVLPGYGEPTGRAICSHPSMRKIDLTGGTRTGRIVGKMAGENLCSVVTELGGKAPLIVFEDCDLEQAVNGAAFAAFVATGQTCIMGSRLIIHESIYEKFMTKLAEKAKRIKIGDPFDGNTQMGPVISSASRQKINSMVNNAIGQNAKVYSGAHIPELPAPFNQGYYYAPTVLGVKTSMNIWHEEVFGPVVVGLPFKDEKEAIALANDSPYGLAAAIWTKDVMRAHRVAEDLQVGLVWINDHHRNDPSSPWGGMKDSGVGRENGISALHEYTQPRSVVVRTDSSPFDWFEQANARYG